MVHQRQQTQKLWSVTVTEPALETQAKQLGLDNTKLERGQHFVPTLS